MKDAVHLICNSHLDPVWLWEWQEGASHALAMAQAAVDIGEDVDYVFNRNESLFYEWIQAYDPPLFEHIRKLVRAGRWHIMGGWYVQPDCNMPSGESFVRQILVGKRFFKKHFGVDVRTAANLDSFGHSRGLVQILAKSGFDSYLFCRPNWQECGLPSSEFRWVGFDGSSVAAAQAEAHYNSPPGGGRQKIEEWIDRLGDKPCRVIPWGVGNHGGGPSRRDLIAIAKLIRQRDDLAIQHSTPEWFFDDLRRRKVHLPLHEGDLNPWAVGCYTSMTRVKQKHRRLENELFMTEKMAATAAAQGLMRYPRRALQEATSDLLASEFHDALPGTSIQPVEEAVVQLLDHGLEGRARAKMKAFFALSAGQRKGHDGTFPILVYNPHPFRVYAQVECELQPPWPHRTTGFLEPRVFARRKRLPAQAEKEHCNIDEDHRKRVIFSAVLEPGRMNRFDCWLELLKAKPAHTLKQRDGRLRFKTKELEVVINARTGLLDRYRVSGHDYVKRHACRPLIMADDADPWGMRVVRYRKRVGTFKLMSPTVAARFCGVEAKTCPPVRVIEDGPVRSVVEVLLACDGSNICQRYKLPKEGTEVEVETRVFWNEKDRMLKLSIPTGLSDGVLVGQTAYGVAPLPSNGDEAVAQQWVAVVSNGRDRVFTCVNDRTYGCDMARGELRVSLLRSPAHSGHPTGSNRLIVAQDRFTTRMDQGETVFRFWLNGGAAGERRARVDREALVKNQRPFALNAYPTGRGELPKAGPTLSDRVVQVTAFKLAEDGNDLIIRLFEPTGRRRSSTLELPFAGAKTKVSLSPFEIKTLRWSTRRRRFFEVNLLEERIGR
jgi:alpha-mannosidase